MKIYSSTVDRNWSTENFITFASSKEEAIIKIKSSVSKTRWSRIKKRIIENITEEDEVFCIEQYWD